MMKERNEEEKKRRSDEALPRGPPVLTGCIVTD